MIYGDKKTGILVQGATGKQGEFHIGLMNAYAKQVGGRGVVAGVTPGKGGKEVHGVPVYNTVKEAMRDHDISASVIFVPAAAAADSIMEEANAGIQTIVAITEHIPVHDYDEGDCLCNNGGLQRDRSQLPRAPLAWRSKDGDHARRALLARECGGNFTERNTHV